MSTAPRNPSSTPSLMPWRTKSGPSKHQERAERHEAEPDEERAAVRMEEVAQPERLAARTSAAVSTCGSSSAGGETCDRGLQLRRGRERRPLPRPPVPARATAPSAAAHAGTREPPARGPTGTNGRTVAP